jgi:hypothetical protein
MKGRLNVKAADWADMFDAFDLLDSINRDGFVDVSAKQFHQLHLQPRLLTKIDHAHQVPPVFAENNLNILTRGIDTWRIGTFEVFHKLPEWTTPSKQVENLVLPSFIDAIDTSNITGEPGVINAAHASGLLSAFSGEEQVLTVGGRMRTGEFSFRVNDARRAFSEINVSKAQIEIDAGMESAGSGQGDDSGSLWLYEVKNHISKDFCIRQLYYPYRTWSQRLDSKPVRTIFLSLANDVYDVHQFEFADPLNYSSIELVKHKRFTIDATLPTEAELVETTKKALASQAALPKTDIPFPQADDFRRVIDVLSFISEEPRTVENLSDYYGFHPRQSDYYGNAVRYLGLAEKTIEDGTRYFSASNLGAEIQSLPYKEKILKIATIILSIEPLAMTYMDWVKNSSRPPLEAVMSYVRATADGAILSEETVRRRSQTIRTWATWLREIAPA